MAVIYLEKTLCGLLSPFVYIILSTLTTSPTITTEVSKLIFVTIITIVSEESLTRVIAKKHGIYFFDLLPSKQMSRGRFIFLPIILICEDVPDGMPWLWCQASTTLFLHKKKLSIGFRGRKRRV